MYFEWFFNGWWVLLVILLCFCICPYCSHSGAGANFRFANVLSILVSKDMEMEFAGQPIFEYTNYALGKV